MKVTRSQLSIMFVNRTNWNSTAANAVQQIKTAHALVRQGAKVEYILPTVQQISSKTILQHFGLNSLYNLKVRPILVPSDPRFTQRVFQIKISLILVMRRAIAPNTVLLTRDPLLLMLFKSLSGKAVFESHDLGDLAYRFEKPVRHQRRQQRAIHTADGIITVTHACSREIQRVCNISSDHICVAPDGAELYEYIPPRLHLAGIEPIRIGYVGSLLPDRDVLTLIHSLRHLHSLSSYRLSLVGGTTEQTERLKRLANQIGVTSQVDFVGHRPHREIPSWLAQSDILVLTLSRGELANKYASPMKLFEYMATYRPILAPDLPTIREIVDEQSVNFFVPENAESLARAIEHVSINWEHALEKARFARNLLENYFTYDIRAQRILSLVNGVVEGVAHN